MGKPYRSELNQIPTTIQWALEQDVTQLRDTLLREFGSRNLIAIGSGGSLVAAAFAALLHEASTGRLARPVTPLEAITRPSTRTTAALLLSARGTNADIRQAAKILPTLGYDSVSAISTTKGSPLGRILAGYGATLHEFSVPSGRDGFLATNSLIATLVLLYRAVMMAGSACGQDNSLATSRSSLLGSPTALSHPNIVVLAQGWAAPAAMDLETRFAEAALANVTVTDPRNFAHGRHNWLSLHAKHTGIVSLETLDSLREAERTLKYLPGCIDVLRVKSAREGPVATIELVITVMELAGSVAEMRGIDPGRPAVPDFGRRLYRAGSTRHFKAKESHPIAKKRTALFQTHGSDKLDLATPLQDFIRRLDRTTFTGLAVDYDGTLCARDHRFEPLEKDIQAELNRLLGEGTSLGVASGRGGSVHEQLRGSIHNKFWDRVVVGLYNGAKIVRLSDELEKSADEIPHLLDAVRSRLQPLTVMLGLDMVTRPYQVSLRPCNGIDPFELRTITIEHLAGIEGVSTIASSHSVDILPAGTSKTTVVDALDTEHGCVLRIGDQGSAGGNDFELLNTGLSLSVDRVSSNLETCWHLGAPGLYGPRLTLKYLRALRGGTDGFHLDASSLLSKAKTRL